MYKFSLVTLVFQTMVRGIKINMREGRTYKTLSSSCVVSSEVRLLTNKFILKGRYCFLF